MTAPNPFPGLRPFLEGEQHLFFGREAQVDTLVDRLGAARLLAVVGTSGSGKSSLVNCGLIPALHRGLLAEAGSGWRVATMRPGNRPLPALADALVRAGLGAPPVDSAGGAGEAADSDDSGFTPAELVAGTLRMSKRGLLDAYALARLATRPNLLVVVDQFEELFRYRGLDGPAGANPADELAGQAGADARSFVDLLLEAANQREHPVYIVLTMRSDFLGDCAQFFGLPEAINRGQVLVPRMTRDERRAAIAGPVAVAGAAIDPVLLTRLVNDVGDNPDQLSILQHALHRTWARWVADGGRGPLLPAHYEAIGTMARALDEHAEEAYAALADERQRSVCERLFKALTDKGSDARGTRRPTRLDQLVAITRASADELRAVIEVFRDPSRAFLMPPAGQPLHDATPVDISHESLMRVWQRLRGWVEREAQSAQVYRRLAETAELHTAGQAGLLRPPDLPFVAAWYEREQPTAVWAARLRPGFDAALAFLQASRDAYADEQAQAARTLAEAQARARRNRRLLGGALALLLVAAVAGGFAWVIDRNRQDEAKLMASQQAAEQQLKEEEQRAAQAETLARQARRQLATMDERLLTVGLGASGPGTTRGIRLPAAVASSPGAPQPAPVAAAPAPAASAAVVTASPSPAPAPPAAVAGQPLVYLQYVDDAQQGAAQRVRARLGQAGYKAPGIEKVRTGPSVTEVRYFRAADAADANALAQRLQQAGWSAPKLRLIEGYGSAAQTPPMEVWLAAGNAQQLGALVAQINVETLDERRAGVQQLLDRYTTSPRAIAEVLATLQPGRLEQLTQKGRSNALYFLTRTAPLAWDPAPVAQARETVARLRARPDSGEQTRAELDRLAALLDRTTP